MKNTTLKHLFWTACVAFASGSAAFAQAISFYNSGSTGADGPFAPVVTASGTSNMVSGVSIPGVRAIQDTLSSTTIYYIDVPLRTNGLYNFTTISIPMNMRVRFIVNSNQLDSPPPVIFLAMGDVTISGEIGLTAKDTSGAYVGGSSIYADNDSHDATGPRWIPGPGGFRGGAVDKDSGMGTSPGIYSNRQGGSENFCLPLVGGSGASWYPGSGDSYGAGFGGSGVIYLASSTKIIFDANYGVTSRGIMFQYSRYSWNVDNRAGSGMAALFANQIVGSPRSSDNTRMLISACQQQVVIGTSIYPMWSTGIIGNNVPTNPSVNIVMVGTNSIPTTNSQTTIYPVSAPGQYPVTVQTMNLPANIVFNITAYQLNQDGTYNGSSTTYVTTPTVSQGGGLCTASVNVTINSGYQFLTSRAKSSITVAMAPTFDGSPVDEWRWDMDRNGKVHTLYATAAGAMLSQEAVMRLAMDQGKWEFVRAYGGQSIPKV